MGDLGVFINSIMGSNLGKSDWLILLERFYFNIVSMPSAF